MQAIRMMLAASTLYAFITSAATAQIVLGGPRTFDAGHDSVAMTSADLNEDGLLDFITGTRFGDVNVILGSASGELAAPSAHAVGGDIRSLITADLDEDGHLDVMASLESIDLVAILLGDGAGTLVAAPTFPAVSRPSGIVAADFDEDGNLDLAVGTGSASTFATLLGDGAGGFGAPITTGISAGGSVDAADFDEDGHLDLVVATPDHNYLITYPGDGAGAFALGAYLSAFRGTVFVAARDMNGDGHADVCAVSVRTDGMRLYVGTGDGTFPTMPFIVLGASPEHLSIADLDSDGAPDLVASNGNAHTISVRPSNASGGLDPIATYVVSERPTATAVSDVDGDGHLDVLVLDSVTGFLTLLAGDGTGAVATAPMTPTPNPGAAAAGDFDEDGHLDVVVSEVFATRLNVLAGSGQGAFEPPIPVAFEESTQQARSLIIADIVEDGHADIAGLIDETAFVLAGDGAGGFAAPTFFTISNSHFNTNLVLADFDRDGHLDLVNASNALTDRFYVAWGDGAGGFSDRAVATIGGGPSGLVATDLDADGYVEVVCSHGEDVTLSVFPSSFTRTISAPAVFPAPSSASVLAAADMNDDGAVDVVLRASGGLWVCSGDGAGSLASPVLLLGGSFVGPTIADMDEDGHLDVVDNSSSLGINVWSGDGGTGFTSSATFGAGSAPSSLIAEDFDGDGHRDVVASDIRSQNIVFLRNRTFERCDNPDVATRAGNVDTGGGGPAANVLRLNGSAGQAPLREIVVVQGAIATLDVAQPPAGGNGVYALWIFDGEPCAGSAAEAFLTAGASTQSVGMASFCLPSNNAVSPASCPCPRTFPIGFTSRAIPGAATAANLCLHPAPALPRAPASLGLVFPPGTFTIQGLIVDPNAPSGPKKVSITNAIVAKVRP